MTRKKIDVMLGFVLIDVKCTFFVLEQEINKLSQLVKSYVI